MIQAGIRFRAITDRSNSSVVVGRRGERVVAFEFRNEGENSIVEVTKDGEGITLVPGEEKPYGVGEKVYFQEEFIINFSVVDGSKSVTHKAVLTEIYERKQQ